MSDYYVYRHLPDPLGMWQGPFRRSDALREIGQRIGRKVTAAQLNKHIGPRGGSPAKEEQ